MTKEQVIQLILDHEQVKSDLVALTAKKAFIRLQLLKAIPTFGAITPKGISFTEDKVSFQVCANIINVAKYEARANPMGILKSLTDTGVMSIQDAQFVTVPSVPSVSKDNLASLITINSITPAIFSMFFDKTSEIRLDTKII